MVSGNALAELAKHSLHPVLPLLSIFPFKAYINAWMCTQFSTLTHACPIQDVNKLLKECLVSMRSDPTKAIASLKKKDPTEPSRQWSVMCFSRWTYFWQVLHWRYPDHVCGHGFTVMLETKGFENVHRVSPLLKATVNAYCASRNDEVTLTFTLYLHKLRSLLRKGELELVG